MNLKESMLRVLSYVTGRKKTKKSKRKNTLEQVTAKALMDSMYVPIQYMSDDSKLKGRLYYAKQNNKMLSKEDSLFVISYFTETNQKINNIISNYAIQKVNTRKG